VKTIFLRLLDVEDKSASLHEAIQNATGACSKQRFEVDPRAFSAVVRSPFAYWVSERVRNQFLAHQPLEVPSLNRIARRGVGTNDDFRFLRLWFETTQTRLGWPPLAKGGEFAYYYSAFPLVLDWGDQGAALRAFCIQNGDSPSRNIRSESEYYRRGLTWSLRTQKGLTFRVMPTGCIFGSKGPAAFVANDDGDELLALLGIANSAGFRSLVDLQMAFGSFEVGVIQRTPVPTLSAADQATLALLARRAWSLKRWLDTRVETSHAFVLPALMQVESNTFADRRTAWSDRAQRIEAELATIQAEIDARCFDLYGIDEADRRNIIEGFGGVGDSAKFVDDDESSETDLAPVDTSSLTAELVSWALGVALGRFDVRLATCSRSVPPEPAPFDPLPICSPAMLTGDDGLPLDSAPAGYLLDVPQNGLLVYDPGHALNLTTALRSVFDVVFGDAAEAYWHEAAALLDPREHNLRQWLAKGFFEHHLKQYSKSRRQAPIYWPLSSSGGNYTIWLYYHRFRRDTLFQALNEFAKPKLQHERLKLESLRGEAGDQPKRSQREAIEAQESFVSELEAFVEELSRVAPLWNPDLNDGVIINYAPLWRMIGHTPWRKSVKECWESLCAGEYDWSHLAMYLWPERVVPKCATDRSLAIAHGLEAVFWEETTGGKFQPRSAPMQPVEDLVRERSSSAVKAALKSLLEAPSPGGSARRVRRGKSHA
jgi:hypothetical protein